MSVLRVILISISMFFMVPALGTQAADIASPGSGILLYHRFHPTRANFTTITNAAFESQIQSLEADGYQFVKLSTLVELIKSNSSIPEKMIAITVDDGHISQYVHMYPILKKYNIPATLFITTNVISRDPNYMSWEQLAEMKASGLIDIQDHTVSHPDFVAREKSSSADNFDRFIEAELLKSKALLNERLGADVRYLAWPYGAYNKRVMKDAERLGYEAAFTCNGVAIASKQDLFALPRLPVVPSITANAIKYNLRNRNVEARKQFSKVTSLD